MKALTQTLTLLLWLSIAQMANAQTIWQIGYPNPAEVTATLKNDTLTINGTGLMTNYPSSNDAPWHASHASIKTVIINHGVNSIGNYAFSSCIDLASLSIGNSVASIGEGAFSGCSGLASLSIGNSVASIRAGAFAFCSSLTSLTIPNSVTTIGSDAFFRCSSLTSLSIPNRVTSIGDYAFSDCSGLTSISISNNVDYIGEGAFSACSGLTSISIPNSVTWIGAHTFSGCSSLTSISIPNALSSIESYVFADCSGLTSISIPNSVTSIKDGAFYGCSGLKRVFNRAAIPQAITDQVYESVALSSCELLVMNNSINLYKAAGVWKDFGMIKPIDSIIIAFNSQGGSDVDTQYIEHGNKITKPTDPTRSKHTFDGWHQESACINGWDFNTDTVLANMTLYAKWNTNTSLQRIVETSKLTVYPNPVKDELRVDGDEFGVGDKLEIFDLKGKQMINLSIPSIHPSINVSTLKPGLYLLKIGDHTVRFVKE